MYKIIGRPASRAFRVMWMLNELGESYELDPATPRDAKVAALNPSGKIPVLIDGEAHITDSVAICQYLADKHGMFTRAAGTVERAHQDSFTQFAVDDIESTLWTMAKHTFVLPEDLRVPQVGAACRYDFDRAMTAFSKRIGDRAYVMGDDFTVPDLILAHCGGWAAMIGWPVNEANVRDYFARVRNRPAFKAAFAQRKQHSPSPAN